MALGSDQVLVHTGKCSKTTEIYPQHNVLLPILRILILLSLYFIIEVQVIRIMGKQHALIYLGQTHGYFLFPLFFLSQRPGVADKLHDYLFIKHFHLCSPMVFLIKQWNLPAFFPGGGGRPFTTPQCIVSQYWNIWTTTFSYISNGSITLLIPTPDVLSSHILSHSRFFSPKWSLCLSHPLLPVFSFKSPLRLEQTYWLSKCLSSNSCLKVTPVRSLPEMYMSYLPIEPFTIMF